MQAASRAHKAMLKPVAAESAAPPRLSRAEKEFADARQDYLEALPIAAFVACLDEQGRSFVDIANDRFREVAGWNERADGKWIEAIAFLEASGIGPIVTAF